MAPYRVTYDIVTAESAQDGDTSENGFILPGGHHVDVDTAMADTEGDYTMSLREALNYCTPQEDCGSWFTEVDERQDYSTGDSERRALHPPETITPASYNRHTRLFKVR